MNYQCYDNYQWAVPGCPRFQSGAPQARSCWKAISTTNIQYLGCSHNRFNMLVRVNYEWQTSEVLLFSFFGLRIFNRFHLTRFLKSAVTSLVNTARLRKPVDTSLLSWVRWLFPMFSRTSMYCSLFSTWAGKNTHTGKMSISRELNIT